MSMGILLIKCPTTGKEFSTGVNIHRETVSALPDYETWTNCPHCNQLHRWRPKDARWVEALSTEDWIENKK
jgi:hypothetical protein